MQTQAAESLPVFYDLFEGAISKMADQSLTFHSESSLNTVSRHVVMMGEAVSKT